MKPKKLKGAVFSEVIAARALAMVMKTHNPPIVQVIRYHTNCVFITVNLLSLPSFLTLKKIVEKYKENIKYTYMDFPINPSGVSKQVALGSLCAQDQGKYWHYHEMAFDNQGKLTKNSPLSFAKKLKLDTGKFSTCLTSHTSITKLNSSIKEAKRLGVEGTPVIYINGVKTLNHSEEGIENIISKIVKKS